jgi:hypothetical protein
MAIVGSPYRSVSWRSLYDAVWRRDVTSRARVFGMVLVDQAWLRGTGVVQPARGLSQFRGVHRECWVERQTQLERFSSMMSGNSLYVSLWSSPYAAVLRTAVQDLETCIQCVMIYDCRGTIRSCSFSRSGDASRTADGQDSLQTVVLQQYVWCCSHTASPSHPCHYRPSKPSRQRGRRRDTDARHDLKLPLPIPRKSIERCLPRRMAGKVYYEFLAVWRCAAWIGLMQSPPGRNLALFAPPTCKHLSRATLCV